MSSYRVTLLDRDGTSFEVQPGETILAAANRAHVPLMSGCGHGACRTCAARLVRGKVHMPEGTSLTPRLVEAQVLLPCVATISRDTEIEVGRAGRSLLHPRHILPWTD